MFGYITVFKDELKIKDFTCYKAYYCGVCKTLGKQYNQLMRLGLSYDMTFLSILLDSQTPDKCTFSNERCIKHIGKKHPVVSNCDSLLFCSDLSVLLTYYKLLDDISDGFSLKSLVMILPYIIPFKKAQKRQPYLVSRIKQHMKELSDIEKSKTDNVDEAAHPFALLMRDIFVGDDNMEKLGYNLGRYIYIIDAADDYEKDKRSGNYNPLVQKFGSNKDEAMKFAMQSLMFTLSQAAQNYNNLKIINNKDILDNIIYLGLKMRVFNVLKGNKNEKSL